MNKKEIEKLRKELQQQRSELIEELEKVKKREESYMNNEVGDDIDKASENIQREILFYFSDHDRHRMDAIDDALQKIDEGRFGICESCGKKIGSDRLNAIPYARLCIKCRPTIENSEA
ncbi:MAG: TraR/DksA family transcriptional regulator [Elusimicrobia bacterium]|nr:TraR/DksA family transcriptional regulator [Elusimicrobiota bacterium]